MARTIRDKFDLFTLATKVKPFTVKGNIEMWLIGTGIGIDDNSYPIVKNFFIDYNTSEIHIDFTDGTDSSFSLREKFWVDIDSRYLSVPSKKKNKKQKRK